MNLEITPQAYQQLILAAQASHTTPEQLVEEFAATLDSSIVYHDADDFFRSLGMTEEQLQQANERAQQLPDVPN